MATGGQLAVRDIMDKRLQFDDVFGQSGGHFGQRLLPAIDDAPLFARARVRARRLLVFRGTGTAFHRFPVEIAVCV